MIFGSLALGPLMKCISERQEWLVNQELKPYGLTNAQARVILYLNRKEGKCCPQKEIEALLDISHPTVVSIVKSMERKGKVEVLVYPSDRRIKIVHLIWGDEALFQKLEKSAEEMEEKLLNGFSKEERELFTDFLKRAYKNVS